MSERLVIAYRGNFSVPFSTESHVAASMEALGHTVVRLQESEVGWAETLDACSGADVFWWTSTWGYAHQWDQGEAFAAVELLNATLPTVAMHLDLFFGLARADQPAAEPWFRLRHVFTADGDHDAEWAALGINHHWMPPAVYGGECHVGTPRGRWRSDIAFVGSWKHYGHEEWWPHRRAMLEALQRRYGRRARFWPRGPAVRGDDLNDLYASTKVVVGDSCLADRSVRYFSDRAFETVGRGGFLVMPRVEGLAELLVDGEHCRYFTPGDHDEMLGLVDHYLGHDEERERIRRAGQAHVRDHHTYAHRVAAILEQIGVAAPSYADRA